MSPTCRTSARVARRSLFHGNAASPTNRAPPALPTKNGAIERWSSSTRFAARNWVWIMAPPSTMSSPIPRSPRSATRSVIVTSPPRPTTTAAHPNRRRRRSAIGAGQYTSLVVSPAVKNAAFGSRSPVAVTVTFHGERARPSVSRRPWRATLRTSSRGLSRRTVRAPTRMASLRARTSSTRSKSASFERVSRGELAVSRYPSSEMAQLRVT